jgi:hypothetical protein
MPIYKTEIGVVMIVISAIAGLILVGVFNKYDNGRFDKQIYKNLEKANIGIRIKMGIFESIIYKSYEMKIRLFAIILSVMIFLFIFLGLLVMLVFFADMFNANIELVKSDQIFYYFLSPVMLFLPIRLTYYILNEYRKKN